MRKLLVCDVEGTIFEAKYKIEGTDYASTMWQPIAHALGEKAIIEERETHYKFDNNEYDSYLHWVEDTFEIHKKYKLNKKQFYKLVNKAQYIEGVVEFFRKLDRDKYIPVLVSGGFKELILRAQRELNIKHGSAACQYIFDHKTDKLVWLSTTPCDFMGKYDYVHSILKEYKLDPNRDWIFIGDGKNDFDIAQRAPFSIGINAHAKLAAEVKSNVSNFNEVYELVKYNERKVFYSIVDNTVDNNCNSTYKPDLSSIKDELNELYRNYHVEVLENGRKKKDIAYYNNLIDNLNLKLEAQTDKSKSLDVDKNKLSIMLENIQLERNDLVSKVKSLNSSLDGNNKEKQAFKRRIVDKDSEILQIKSKLIQTEEQLEQLAKSIKDNKDRKEVYTTRKIKTEIKKSDSDKRLDSFNYEYINNDNGNKFEKSITTTITSSNKSMSKQWLIRSFYDSNVQKGKTPKRVDMLLVSSQCIFVIEAKKYFGTIVPSGGVKNTVWFCDTPEGNSVPIESTGYLNPYDQVSQYTDNIVGNLKSSRTYKPVLGIVVFPSGTDISNIGEVLTDHCFVTTEEKIVSTMEILDIKFKQKYSTPPEKTMQLLLDMQ